MQRLYAEDWFRPAAIRKPKLPQTMNKITTTHTDNNKNTNKKKYAPTVFSSFFFVAFLSHRLGKTNIWPLEFGERVPQSIWPPIRIMMPSWSLGWRSAKWDGRQLNIHHASTATDGIIIWIVVNYFEWWLMVSDRRIVLFVSAYIPRGWSFAIN